MSEKVTSVRFGSTQELVINGRRHSCSDARDCDGLVRLVNGWVLEEMLKLPRDEREAMRARAEEIARGAVAAIADAPVMESLLAVSLFERALVERFLTKMAEEKRIIVENVN